MTPRVSLGLLAALASASALNWGFFAQHGAASKLPPLQLRRPLRSLRLLFGSRPWLVGFFIGLSGWALYVLALALAPLSLVQATSAGGIGILALLVHFRGSELLTRAEWLGVALSVGGLLLLAGSLAGGTPGSGGSSAGAVAAWLACSAAVAALVAGPAGLRLAAGAGLGLASGVLYAAGDVATKAATTGLVTFVPAILAAHGLAFVCLQLGFQRGGSLATAGLSTLMTNALPIVAGVALFSERLPGGGEGALRVVAFVLVTAGAALLARRSAGGDTVSQGSSRSMSKERGVRWRRPSGRGGTASAGTGGSVPSGR